MKYLALCLLAFILFKTADAQVERKKEKRSQKMIPEIFSCSNYKTEDNARESITTAKDYYLDKRVNFTSREQTSAPSPKTHINSNVSSLTKVANYKTQNNAVEILIIRKHPYFSKGTDNYESY